MRTREFKLSEWQHEAVEAWERGADGSPRQGTLEIFTGGGKTLIALEAAARTTAAIPDVRVVVVVPTQALARQWLESTAQFTDTSPAEVGLLGAGGHDDPRSKQMLVAVLNSAAKHLPAMLRDENPDRTMLIVDECHRAGAPTFSNVLKVPATFRLGLSATPERDELGEDGEPVSYDGQIVGQHIGPVVYRFTLKDARDAGWLPDYQIHHHAVGLVGGERSRYDEVTRKIDDLSDELRDHGVDPLQARVVAQGTGPLAKKAAAWVAATGQRKDVLYRSAERSRIAFRLVTAALQKRPESRILLFHERVGEAAALEARLQAELPLTGIALEHSRLATAQRTAALQGFRDGRVQVLVSVRSLIEGIDVPEADVGISVASSSSVRQRIQSLGRVLRRGSATGPSKVAMMHVVYVRDTVDDLIYSKEDWSDLTGDAANQYWSWPVSPDAEPERMEGPPHTPLPTEDQERGRLQSLPPIGPERWLGGWPPNEYSIDSRGTVRNVAGRVIANPQSVERMIAAVRGTGGGRFGVTPKYRFVIVRSDQAPRALYVVGALGEPFETRVESDQSRGSVDATDLVAGDTYPGADDTAGGKFRIGQKRGGVIERRTKGGRQFALTAGSDAPGLEKNAAAVLDAWRSLSTPGLHFVVNGQDDAVYWDGGALRFLAHVPGGFSWPSHPPEQND